MFNGLGQLTVEYQAHSGAVDTATTPRVQYGWSEMSGGANHSRLTSMTYPNGKVLNYLYATGLNNNISRLSSLTDSTGTLESYDYLGLGTVVRRAHPQPGVDLTFIKQTSESNGDAGDQYTGLDRFGRIFDQRWLKTSGGTHTDRFQYGYDRNGNRLFEKNLVDAAFSELYQANGPSAGYDKLNQLTDFRRGVLSDSNSDGIPDTVTTASRSQAWDFDALGNFDNQTTNGSGQTRSHNRQNQITSIQGLTNPAYDANGNLTTDQSGKTLIYDAWNRLVEVKNGSTTLIDYAHDALTRRITENTGTVRALFYSSQWQVVEERVSGLAVVQHVWSPVYVDAMIPRDRDTDANGSLDERLWVQHDANFNVTALINTSGTVVERYAYDPFGTPTFYDASYVTRSGSNFAWRHLHQGGAYEGLTGLYHFRNREYSPTLGRWIQVDPIGFAAGDVNWYRAFANAAPNHNDSSGLDIYIITGANIDGNPSNRRVHQDIAVDVWTVGENQWVKIGKAYFTFAVVDETPFGLYAGFTWLGEPSIGKFCFLEGRFVEADPDTREGGTITQRLSTSPEQDIDFLLYLRNRVGHRDGYSVGRHNCRLRAYPNNPMARCVMRARAKWSMAR